MTEGPEFRRVAVVGAGLSGLTCARTLHERGYEVAVFDKGRAPGGRMSSRRGGRSRYDHGAQYFTARDPRFARRVESWARDGLVARWEGAVAELEAGQVRFRERDAERWVALPAMGSLCEHLAVELSVMQRTAVARIERETRAWSLIDDGGRVLGDFDAVVVSAPAPQSAALLEPISRKLARRIRTVSMAPCWATMATFEESLGVDFAAAFVRDSALSWIARDGSKPGRDSADSWILHGSPEWSERNLELERGEAATRLLDAFEHALGRSLPGRRETIAHRWRYALPTEPLPESHLFDETGLAACGDWCAGPRVEGAFLSGAAAAERLLTTGRPPRPDSPNRPETKPRRKG